MAVPDCDGSGLRLRRNRQASQESCHEQPAHDCTSSMSGSLHVLSNAGFSGL